MGVFKKNYIFAFSAAAALMTCNLSQASDQALKNDAQEGLHAKAETNDIDMQKISEAFGNFIGRNLKSNGVEFNLEGIVKGMRDGAAGKPAPLNEQEYEQMMAKLQEKAFNALADTNLKAANEFLKTNASAAGVVEIVPGKLQYLILEQGHGPAIPEHGSPLINYTGKYIDGTVFGSSLDAGAPITVPLDQTVPGFSKGLVNMKEGEKRRLFVHPEMGYGRAGHLAPNALLIFEIEAVKATSPEKIDDDSAFSDDDGDLDDEDLNGIDNQEYEKTPVHKQ